MYISIFYINLLYYKVDDLINICFIMIQKKLCNKLIPNL